MGNFFSSYVRVGWMRTEWFCMSVAALQIREPHLKTHLPSLSVVAPVGFSTKAGRGMKENGNSTRNIWLSLPFFQQLKTNLGLRHVFFFCCCFGFRIFLRISRSLGDFFSTANSSIRNLSHRRRVVFC